MRSRPFVENVEEAVREPTGKVRDHTQQDIDMAMSLCRSGDYLRAALLVAATDWRRGHRTTPYSNHIRALSPLH